MVPQTGSTSDSDRPLEMAWLRDPERLRSANAVGSCPLKRCSKLRQIIGAFNFAMTVDDYDQISLCLTNADITRCTGPPLWIRKQL